MRLVITLLVALLPLAAQEKAPDKDQDKSQEKAPAKAQDKKPAPNPTNLKILKASNGQEVRQIMRTFTTGLGVQCSYCHVQGNFASDENPKKEVARHMIAMTQKVNAEFTDGKMHVTCFTCHRGEAEPKTAPEPKPSQ